MSKKLDDVMGRPQETGEDQQLEHLLEQAKEQILILQHELMTFMEKALVHAVVIAAGNEIDPLKFLANDPVVIMMGRHQGRLGRLVGAVLGKPCVDKDGKVSVMLSDLTKGTYSVGLNGTEPEVRLIGKNDGTHVTVSYDGTLYEVNGVWGKDFAPGNHVKVSDASKQIIDTEGMCGPGDVASVKKVIDRQHIEIEHNGLQRVVINGQKEDAKVLEAGDRVQLDRSGTILLNYIEHEDETRYTLSEELNVCWDDIGGCENAKEAMIEAVELPFKHPGIFKFYNKKQPKGVLLYGGPGRGKTLIAKATAFSVAKSFGKQALQTGFIYVKGPEVKNKWFGNTEANIRELFARGRAHFKKHKFPAILFIDEAEAILPQRGRGHGGEITEHTAVPMFLSEMDGLEDSGVFVILATNRPNLIDPAATRPGRIDRHILVPRPDEQTTTAIAKLHLRGVPLHKAESDSVAVAITKELFSEELVLYRIMERSKQQHLLRLSDCMNGAMIASVVEQASSRAIKRDLTNGTKLGVKTEDFVAAVAKIYEGQTGQNHNFDIEEFVEERGLDKDSIQIAKYTPSK